MFAAHNMLLTGAKAVVPVSYKASYTNLEDSSTGQTVTIPTHSAGDLIIIYALNVANSTAIPTAPSAGGTVPTWTTITTYNATRGATRIVYAIATSSSTTSGTWTNANSTALVAVVMANPNTVTPIGASAINGYNVSSAFSADVVAPAVTMTKTDGKSQLLHFGAAYSAISTWTTSTSGYTERKMGSYSFYQARLLTKDVTTSDGAVTMQSPLSGYGTGGASCATVEVLSG